MSAHCKVCGGLIFDEDGQCYGTAHPPGSGVWVCDEDACREAVNLPPLLPMRSPSLSEDRFMRSERRKQAASIAQREDIARRGIVTTLTNVLDEEDKELLSVVCPQHATEGMRGRLVLTYFVPSRGVTATVILHETDNSFNLRQTMRYWTGDIEDEDEAYYPIQEEI